MEIKVGGVYRTRGGDRVIINCIGENLGDFWPIKGVVVRDHNEYHSWCLKGRHLSANQESWLDLVALWEDEEVAAPYPSAPNEVPTATLVTSGGKCESPDAVIALSGHRIRTSVASHVPSLAATVSPWKSRKTRLTCFT